MEDKSNQTYIRAHIMGYIVAIKGAKRGHFSALVVSADKITSSFLGRKEPREHLKIGVNIQWYSQINAVFFGNKLGVQFNSDISCDLQSLHAMVSDCLQG